MSEESELVRRGYDAIADRYAEWSQTVKGSPAVTYLERLLELLPDGSRVLELGCGNGEPAARMLADRHRYTGVDISEAQLRRAAALVPEARLLQADYTRLELAPCLFDAVVALYTFGHVPRQSLLGVLEAVAAWLTPGGHLLATFGSRDLPDDVQDDWLGVPMFFAGFDVETNLALLDRAGLGVVEHEVVEIDEGEEGLVSFLWVLARKPG